MDLSSPVSPPRPAWKTFAVFALLSAAYFADTLLRASHKPFWYDELFTVYLCRLPAFHDTWAAVLHGTDFNPPLFYLLTQGSERLFGEGQIATRLPSLIGFWIFGVCLYTFAARRLGRLCGLIAGLAPIFTAAYGYAYEARASAMVLSWCGLMLVCWQRTREPSHPEAGHGYGWRWYGWMLALSACFLAALCTHVYAAYLAAPFLLVEAGHKAATRKLHVARCAALLVPLALVAPMYLRMWRAFTVFTGRHGPPFDPFSALQKYIHAVYWPALALLILLLADIASRPQNDPLAATAATPRRLAADEWLLSCLLLALPVFGALGVLATHGPFQNRYFLCGIAGYALLLAQACSPREGSARLAKLIAASMMLLLATQLAATVSRSDRSTAHQDAATAGLRLLRNSSTAGYGTLDILVTAGANYLVLYYYAPPAMRAHFVFGSPDPAGFYPRSYRALATWAEPGLHTASYDEFFASHDDFLVYTERESYSCTDCLQPFLEAGYQLRSVAQDGDARLAHFSR